MRSSVVVAPGPRVTGSIAVVHGLACSVACGSSRIRGRIHVSCTGRPIPYHSATREAPEHLLTHALRGYYFARAALRRRRQWQPTPVFLPGKSHGQRSLVGCSPWGRTESDTTE